MDNSNDRYLEFASNISFFEFNQPEFKFGTFNIESVSKEVEQLASRTDWNIAALQNFIQNNPKSFLIFQAIFQQLRFTNAQMIHFLFKVDQMNGLNIDSAYEYAVQNLVYDPIFRDIFMKVASKLVKNTEKYESVLSDQNAYPKKTVVALFKISVPLYASKTQEDLRTLEFRLSKVEFSDGPVRIANYLLTNLKLNDELKSINIKEYLKNNKVPLDTKGIHGRYLKMRINKILDDHGYENIDKFLGENRVKRLSEDLVKQLPNFDFSNKKLYCTEKYVEEVKKKVNGKEKKLDLIIISNGKPSHLFEMNFYTTEGTKIGINEGEYVDLYEFVKNKTHYTFHWITDGNYWLTEQGEKRLENLWSKLGEIYNANSFENFLYSLK